MIRALLLCFGLVACARAAVPKIKLNDGREMPAIALGTWLGYSSAGRLEPKSTETEQAVMWAIDAGYRHIDTAKIYKVEDQVGSAVNKKISDGTVKREDMFITTKLWNDAHARDAVIPALRESLSKLNLTYVDLYLIHWPVGQFDNLTYDFTDYLETWRGMIEAKQLGLTKSIGLSNFNQQMMDRIHENGLETPAALQVELNLNLQQPELLAYCKSKGIAVMGYTPFGSLFPSKAKEDAPPPRVDEPRLVEIATKYNKTVPQVVLRYLVELGVVPLPKSLTKSRIEQNLQVFDFSLTKEEKDLLKGYDKGYRTISQEKWQDHPYFPFEKTTKA
ncbi:aldo/keto reductase family domain-containing protein [Phthorimaea operculella]|nr:aldo/keto reductase family domain-containing protein [Phthorimaea operculella]